MKYIESIHYKGEVKERIWKILDHVSIHDVILYAKRRNEEHDKENELMAHLEEIFESYFDNVPTMTAVNEYLWFEPETIFESLGISETEEEEEEIDCKV